MSLVKELSEYIQESNQSVFIEAEGKSEKIQRFICQYNQDYKPNITHTTDGIIELQADADKWGLELRLYLHDSSGAPKGLKIAHNNCYRGNYSYRINDMSLIRDMFAIGYRIGLN